MMTNSEVFMEVYQRQGFIVVVAHQPFPIGHVFNAAREVTNPPGFDQPFCIVALATREEMLRQMDLAQELLGFGKGNPGPGDYFYKAVTE